MINKVILIGNLGKDPQARNAQSGNPVTTFSMATSRRWNDADGNRQEKTEWHQIVCFGRLAEIAGKYLERRRQVYVEGRLQTRSWEDRQTGERRYSTEVVCENLQMLGGRGEAEATAPAEVAVEPAPAEEPAAEESAEPEPAAELAKAKPAPRKRTRRKPAKDKKS